MVHSTSHLYGTAGGIRTLTPEGTTFWRSRVYSSTTAASWQRAVVLTHTRLRANRLAGGARASLVYSLCEPIGGVEPPSQSYHDRVLPLYYIGISIQNFLCPLN